VFETSLTFNALERGARLDDSGSVLARALYAANIYYAFFDLDSPGNALSPLVMYAGGALVSTQQLATLEEYVHGGGTLLLFQPPTLRNVCVAPVGVTTAAAPQRLSLALGDHSIELSSPSVYQYEHAEPLIA
jgi:hypothetical protein